jgi:DNA-binding transcriptional regulator YiaG
VCDNHLNHSKIFQNGIAKKACYYYMLFMAKSIKSKDSEILCTLLVAAREAVSLTQKQVADTGLITQSKLSKLENGQRKVDFLTLIHLAKLYKKDITFFIPK